MVSGRTSVRRSHKVLLISSARCVTWVAKHCSIVPSSARANLELSYRKARAEVRVLGGGVKGGRATGASATRPVTVAR